MIKNLPSKRYDLFIKAFEKKVEEAQKAIAKMDKLMRPYEICRAALEKAELENETKLELNSDGIRVTIIPLQADKKGFYQTVLTEIGKELQRSNLHSTGEASEGVTSYDFFHRWSLKGFTETIPPKIELRIDVPMTGTDYIKIIEDNPRIQTYTEVDRKPVWIDTIERHKITNLSEVDEIPF